MTNLVRSLNPNLWLKMDDTNVSSGSAAVNDGGPYAGRPFRFRTADWIAQQPGVVPRSAYSVQVTDGGIGIPTDPYFSDVGLLLHLDTDFTDSSASAHVETISSIATISSAQSVFGGASANINGFVYYSLDSSLDISSGDFCIEFRFRPTTVSAGTFSILGIRDGASNAMLYLRRNGAALELRYSLNGTTYGIAIISSTGLTNNTWHAICCERTGSTFRLMVDGAVTGSDTNASALFYGTSPILRIGGEPSGNAAHGYYDEFRLTKHSRYGGAYSLATEAFPSI